MGNEVLLLDKIKNISKELSADAIKEYNLLKVLEVWNKEVMMCRILADILNPQGSHRQGTKYLKSFLMNILDMKEMSEKDIEGIGVYKEYLIENDRRIDIVLKNKTLFIPIEVKIYAKDQQGQCYDYYKHACKECMFEKDARIVYLTIFKAYPSKESVSAPEDDELQVPEKKIVCKSFADDIRIWMEHLMHAEEGIMRDVFRQYIEAIDDFSGRPNKEFIMKISKEISSSEENLRSGLQIVNAINQAKAEVLRYVMEEMEHQMEAIAPKYGLEKKDLWCYYMDKATEEFYSVYSTYPGISYKIKGADMGENISLWFRIEIEHRLFAGFCLFDDSSKMKVNLTSDLWDKASKYFKNKLEQTETEWLLWKYLPTGEENLNAGGELVPNFKIMNNKAIELADKEKRVVFAKNAISVMENKLLSQIQLKK